MNDKAIKYMKLGRQIGQSHKVEMELRKILGVPDKYEEEDEECKYKKQ